MKVLLRKKLLSFSRRLRRDQTDAERKMGSLLRSRRFAGFKFRRQEVVGPHIVDFCCFLKKLAMELDGGQHAERQEHDQERTNDLEKRGFRVLRFWNNDVLQQTEAVAKEILAALNTTLTPTLSHPRRERGKDQQSPVSPPLPLSGRGPG